MPKLGVNIDHVATIRETRKVREPDPIAAAVLCELAGAHGITVHLREDRRHIQERDVRLLRQTVNTLNLEMAATPEMLQFAIDLLPDMVTLVPERREELTTEGGLDVVTKVDEISRIVSSLQKHNVSVSLFIEPELSQVKAAARTGAYFIELHTGAYSTAYDLGEADWEEELAKLVNMAQVAQKSGRTVNAGHGLNYRNVGPVAEIDGIWELNIGHSIVSRAVLVGMDRAVRDMLALIERQA
jgi:pyridoxine 5-phosphate synthase